MKPPPPNATRISHQKLEEFTRRITAGVGMPEEHVERLAPLLVLNDLRGNATHGSRQLFRYARNMTEGTINPTPNVRMVHETPTSLIMDGDGGLGYFPAYEGTLKTIEKAERMGMAAMVCRNHGHIGAAGIYARLAAERDLCAFVTSGMQLNLQPQELIYKAAGGSPMAFSAPTGESSPFVLDCGVTHDIQGNPPHRDEVAALTPGIVLRAVGFGTVAQVWGGLLTGISADASKANRPFSAAHQGTLVFAFQVSQFAELTQFKREMDEYNRRVRQLTPIEGTEGAYLPGGVEAEREMRYRQHGIPLSEPHKEMLQKAADVAGIETPWGDGE